MLVMDDYEEIELLEGFEFALLGAVYEQDGTPVPCYQRAMICHRARGLQRAPWTTSTR